MATLLVLLVTTMSYVPGRALSAENRRISPISQMKPARRSSLVIRHFLLYAFGRPGLHPLSTVVFLIPAAQRVILGLAVVASRAAAGHPDRRRAGALAADAARPLRRASRLLAGGQEANYAVPRMTMLLRRGARFTSTWA